MTRPLDILEVVRKESGVSSPEEVCLFGDPTSPTLRAVVCWMATLDAIRFAGEYGADLIVCHEALFFPYDAEIKGGTGNFMSWCANAHRANLLAHYNLRCIRLHPSADKISILDAFAEDLGLGQPAAQEGDFDVAYDLVPPITFGDLTSRVRDAGFPVLRRSRCDDSRLVNRVGLPWGGMGLSVNANYLQRLIEMGCDAFIAGESDSYSFQLAVDSDVPMIETGHEASENAGLRRFTDWLQTHVADVAFTFYETQPAYET